MVNLNELRRGNLIEYDEDAEIVTVEGIDERGVIANWNKEEFDWTWCEANCYSPIDLTPEWLERAGFEKRMIGFSENKEVYMNFSFVVDIWENKFMYGYMGGNIEIKYVHQLQNLYHALTGKELEFNLYNLN